FRVEAVGVFGEQLLVELERLVVAPQTLEADRDVADVLARRIDVPRLLKSLERPLDVTRGKQRDALPVELLRGCEAFCIRSGDGGRSGILLGVNVPRGEQHRGDHDAHPERVDSNRTAHRRLGLPRAHGVATALYQNRVESV